MTIKYKNSTVATTASPEEDAFIRQFGPDQETYKSEQQRPFEILPAPGFACDGHHAEELDLDLAAEHARQTGQARSQQQKARRFRCSS